MPAWLFAVLALAFLLGDRSGQGHPTGPMREAYLLFREGQLLEARVLRASVIVLRHSRATRAVLALGPDGGREVVLSLSGTPPEVVPGAVLPLLIHPGSRYTAAFVAGRATAAR